MIPKSLTALVADDLEAKHPTKVFVAVVNGCKRNRIPTEVMQTAPVVVHHGVVVKTRFHDSAGVPWSVYRDRLARLQMTITKVKVNTDQSDWLSKFQSAMNG